MKDLDLARGEIRLRDGKGRRDRVTMVADALVKPLAAQLEEARRLHDADLAAATDGLELADALRQKYPNAAREWPHVLNRGGRGVRSPLDTALAAPPPGPPATESNPARRSRR
ncbi:MAG: hypothetical protein IT373_23590 [Polyangiaceae bacterium]|nr:hypothetical protein [Polyangiaceae bacterium]